MKKKHLCALLLLAGIALAATRYHGQPVAWIPVAVPANAEWQTTRADGTVELWASEPHKLKVDFGGIVWTTDDGVLVGSIVGGAVPTNPGNTKRRVK